MWSTINSRSREILLSILVRIKFFVMTAFCAKNSCGKNISSMKVVSGFVTVCMSLSLLKAFLLPSFESPG